jgi:prevent-host-death family protein
MTADEVSVRELRQNLSVYLRRVREGDTFAVTSRGERVAVLAPIRGGSRLDRLIAAGAVSPPARPWTDLAPPPAGGESPRALTNALLAQRDEESR